LPGCIQNPGKLSVCSRVTNLGCRSLSAAEGQEATECCISNQSGTGYTVATDATVFSRVTAIGGCPGKHWRACAETDWQEREAIAYADIIFL